MTIENCKKITVTFLPQFDLSSQATLLRCKLQDKLLGVTLDVSGLFKITNNGHLFYETA